METETTTPPLFTFELYNQNITRLRNIIEYWPSFWNNLLLGIIITLTPLGSLLPKNSSFFIFSMLIFAILAGFVTKNGIIMIPFKLVRRFFSIEFEFHAPQLSFFENKLVFKQGESFLEIAKKWRFLQVTALPPLAFSYQEIRIMHLQHIVKPETWLKGAPPAEILLKFQTDTGSFSCEMRLHHAGQTIEIQKMLQFLYEKGLKIEERNHEGDVLYLLQNQSPSGKISPYYQQLIEEIGKN